ncbi:MAG TPA: 5-formyltetrahydrofolate cyclo-ligase [Rhodocyclaceae bacterium]|nr:5-formyltetrahydrofolate cyclo-ligase [Rhodocyclaceae bacterium]
MGDPLGDHGFDSALFRSEQRQARIAARQAMSSEEIARASATVETHLATLLTARPPQVISFCWPVRNEFDCRPLVGRLLAIGWRACQPVVVAPAAPMEFRAWTPATPMTTDRYGIPIPAKTATTAIIAVPDVVLLPLVAFDELGFRLGYGGGYFDRTLAALATRPLAVGVGFELARVDTVRPEAHDIRLDAIVTEAGIRRIGPDACVPIQFE